MNITVTETKQIELSKSYEKEISIQVLNRIKHNILVQNVKVHGYDEIYNEGREVFVFYDTHGSGYKNKVKELTDEEYERIVVIEINIELIKEYYK